MRPICSVIIPTKDCLNYLAPALASVRKQDMAGVEIVVIDDGSTDGTRAWLETLGIPSLRIVDGPQRGPAGARNSGLAAANADFIAFLDADDEWSIGKLGPQLDFHRAHPEVSFSFTDYLHVDVEGRSHGTCFEYWKFTTPAPDATGFAVIPDAEAVVLGRNPVGTSTVVCRTRDLQIANGFDESLQSAEDLDLWLRLAAMAPMAASAKVLATYLMHRPGNRTSAMSRRIHTLRHMEARYLHSDEPRLRNARRALASRIAEAESDEARVAGYYAKPLAKRLKAFALNPSLRLARESLRETRDLLRYTFSG